MILAAPAGLWPLYRALAGLGLACAGLIAIVHQWTEPIVAAKRLAALEATVREVVPGAETSEPWLWTGDGFEATDDPAAADVWVARAADGRLAGLAVQGVAMGYQDAVRVLWGYDPATRRIVGMRVLESRETPGLGDRIGKDPAFLAAFADLPAEPATEGDGLAEPPVVVKGGAASPTEVDALTGATISSRAVVAAVSDAAATWVPRIVAHVESFRKEVTERAAEPPRSGFLPPPQQGGGGGSPTPTAGGLPR